MQLKLIMNFTDDLGQAIHRATVTKWHKREGEAVDYGDLLLDLKVEEVLIPLAQKDLLGELRKLDQQPSYIADLVARRLEGVDQGEEEPPGDRLAPIQWEFFVRIRSLERGVLRRVYSKGHQGPGDLLALFTTEENEPIETSHDQLASCDVLRVNSSVFEPDPQMVVAPKTANGRVEKRYLELDHGGVNYLIFRSDPRTSERIGIYARGSCDLNMVFACKPLIQQVFPGTCCVIRDGSVADSRSDLLLQSCQGLPEELLRPLEGKLRVHPDCFQPKLFEKTFVVPGPDGPEEFPKTLIFLSTGADLTRTLYRHRQHGFLVDPGGGWLNEPLENLLTDLSAIEWFRETFVSVGKITPEKFYENFGKVIRILKDRTNAHILVFNQLTVEPNSQMHNYQFVRSPQSVRRTELLLGLVELSRKLDFCILDVDRLLKRIGIRTQLDWDHPHPKVNLLIAREAFRIMQEHGVFPSAIAPREVAAC